MLPCFSDGDVVASSSGQVAQRAITNAGVDAGAQDKSAVTTTLTSRGSASETRCYDRLQAGCACDLCCKQGIAQSSVRMCKYLASSQGGESDKHAQMMRGHARIYTTLATRNIFHLLSHRILESATVKGMSNGDARTFNNQAAQGSLQLCKALKKEMPLQTHFRHLSMYGLMRTCTCSCIHTWAQCTCMYRVYTYKHGHTCTYTYVYTYTYTYTLYIHWFEVVYYILPTRAIYV